MKQSLISNSLKRVLESSNWCVDMIYYHSEKNSIKTAMEVILNNDSMLMSSLKIYFPVNLHDQSEVKNVIITIERFSTGKMTLEIIPENIEMRMDESGILTCILNGLDKEDGNEQGISLTVSGSQYHPSEKIYNYFYKHCRGI